MIIEYRNHNGGINNLIVITENLNPYFRGVTATSTKGIETAIKNCKRNYKKAYNKAYIGG